MRPCVWVCVRVCEIYIYTTLLFNLKLVHL